MIIKKKGQIVPKNIVQIKPRSLQHLIVFGCDVEITGKKVTGTSPGFVFFMQRSYIGGNKKKPKRYAQVSICGVNVKGFTSHVFEV